MTNNFFNKKKVLLRAPLLTVSGYGVHSRQIFDYLYHKKNVDLDVQILNWGQTPWSIVPEEEEGLIGKIMSCSRELKDSYDMSIQVQLPNEWDSKLADKNIGVSAFVETDICNPKWLDDCNRMSEIIVPSSFTKSVIKNSGVCFKQINVIPEHYNKHIEKKAFNDKIDLKLKSKFNFLILGQLTGHNALNDRKNIANMIKWFCEEFEGRNDVGLVLKTNMGRCSLRDREVTVKVVKNIVDQFRKSSFPIVEIIHGNMKGQEIAQIYKDNKIKCLVSATRGEGYGLPLVDAAASGLPIAVTGWSGHLEFLERDKITEFDYDLKEIHKSRVDNKIFMEGSKWAEVNEKEFKKKLVHVFENYKEAKKNAQRLQQNVKSRFSREAVFSAYDKVLGKYLD